MIALRFLLCACFVFAASVARADIYRWDTGEVIPGTEGIEPGPGVVLSDWNAESHNLRRADFSGKDLQSAVFRSSWLDEAYFNEANLTGADLRANLTGADLSHATLVSAVFGTGYRLNGNVTDAKFDGAVVNGTVFSGAGLTREQLYSTSSYLAKDLRGLGLWDYDLTGWDFSGQDLTGTRFFVPCEDCYGDSMLAGANFTDAIVTEVDFSTYGLSPIAASQIYSTASYRRQVLAGIGLGGIDLHGWDLSYRDLRDAYLYTNLEVCNLVGADLRGTYLPDASGAMLLNAIHHDGAMLGLTLQSGDRLLIRDDDGRSRLVWWGDPRPPVAISMHDHMSVADGAMLSLIFEADPWDSLISFEPGIPVQLGGTLEFTFTDDVDVTTQIGRTLHIFDWSGVEPTGAFTVSSTYPWDVSQLYTSGEVTLLLPGDTNGDQTVDLNDLNNVRNNFGGAGAGDTNNDGIVDLVDLNNVRNFFGATAPEAVPEPSAGAIAIVVAIAIGLPACRRYLFVSFRKLVPSFSVLLLGLDAACFGQFTEIVVFGDSLSDVGNWARSAGFPNGLPPPYFGGRISNGPLWVEHLADRLGLPRPTASLTGGSDFAWAGGTTGSIAGEDVNMDTLVVTYLAARTPRPDELFVLWGGANDFFLGQQDPHAPAQQIGELVTALADAGAQHLLVVNLPTYFGISPLNAGLTTHAVAFDEHLAGVLDDIRTLHSGVVITEFDYSAFFEKVAANPAEFGFQDTLNPACSNCFSSSRVVVPNPDAYYFWDDVHPSTSAHRLIAAAAESALMPLMGDTNFDRSVDLADLNHVRNHFGASGTGVLGDTNNDGIVDLVDLNNVRNSFGKSSPQAVPEPSGLLLAVMAGATCSVARRISACQRSALHYPLVRRSTRFARRTSESRSSSNPGGSNVRGMAM